MILGAVWSVDMYKTVKTTNGFACSFATILSDIQNGYKDDKITFAGIGGFKYMLQSLRDEVEQMRKNKDVTALDSIINRNFPQAKTALQASLKSYYDGFKDKKISTCQPGTNLPDVSPGVVTSLKAQINDDIQKEMEALIKVGDSLDGTARKVKGMVSSLSGDVLKVYDTVLGTINKLHSGMGKFKGAIARTLRFDKMHGYMKTALIMFGLSIFGLILLNLFIMFVTMKMKKCLWMNCLSCIIMTGLCFLGAIISLVSVIFMIFSVLFINGCYFYDQVLVDNNYGKDIINNESNQFIKNCLLKDSSGDYSFLFGEKSTDFMKDLNIFKDLGSFSNQIKNYASITVSPSFTKYKDETLAKMLSYQSIDILPREGSFQINLKKLNTQAQTFQPKDTYVLNGDRCPAGYQKSTETDDVNTGKGSNYCIIIPKFKPTAIDPRYAPKTEANAPYAAMKKCTGSHDKLITDMTSSLNTGPIQSSQSYLTKVKNSQKDAEALEGKMKKTNEFLGAMKNGLKGVLDCRILRRQFDLVRSSLCDKEIGFGMKFALQAWLLTFIGPLLSCLGCCLCCQTRLADRDKDKLDYETDMNIELQGENSGKGNASFLSNNLGDNDL